MKPSDGVVKPYIETGHRIDKFDLDTTTIGGRMELKNN